MQFMFTLFYFSLDQKFVGTINFASTQKIDGFEKALGEVQGADGQYYRLTQGEWKILLKVPDSEFLLLVWFYLINKSSRLEVLYKETLMKHFSKRIEKTLRWSSASNGVHSPCLQLY